MASKQLRLDACRPLQAVTGTNFAHLCLQKLYVLCSRGAQAQVACLQEVAQLSLPVLLARCRGVLRGYLAAGGDGGPAVEEVRLALVVLDGVV